MNPPQEFPATGEEGSRSLRARVPRCRNPRASSAAEQAEDAEGTSRPPCKCCPRRMMVFAFDDDDGPAAPAEAEGEEARASPRRAAPLPEMSHSLQAAALVAEDESAGKA